MEARCVVPIHVVADEPSKARRYGLFHPADFRSDTVNTRVSTDLTAPMQELAHDRIDRLVRSGNDLSHDRRTFCAVSLGTGRVSVGRYDEVEFDGGVVVFEAQLVTIRSFGNPYSDRTLHDGIPEPGESSSARIEFTLRGSFVREMPHVRDRRDDGHTVITRP